MKKDTKKAKDKKKAGRKTGVKSWVKVKKYMYEQKHTFRVDRCRFWGQRVGCKGVLGGHSKSVKK